MATAHLQFEAASLSPLETAGPTVESIGTNVKRLAWALDDTTPEYLNWAGEVPVDIDSAGTVTFRVHGRSKTAVASKNVAFNLEWHKASVGTALDPVSPYTTEASGDVATDATQDNDTVAAWTETVATLGWVAKDILAGRLSRVAPTVANLVGDFYALMLVIDIPLA